MIAVDPEYFEFPLSSGARCRVWITDRWAVIEANGLISYAPQHASRMGSPLPAWLVAEMAPALMEAAT